MLRDHSIALVAERRKGYRVAQAGEFSSHVNALAVQTDGRILIGGMFTNLCGQARSRR